MAVALCGLVAWLSLEPARAELIPVLKQVPKDLPADVKERLATERERLENDYAQFKKAGDAFSQKPAAQQSDAEYEKLQAWRTRHIRDANAFNREVAAASRQAQRIRAQKADAHFNLGVALVEQGRYQEAEKAFRQAIRFKPKNADAHNNLGVTLNRQRRYQEAEKALRQALKLNPKDANAHSNLGIALWEQGRHQEAEAAFRQALKLNPQLEAARHNLQRAEKLQERVDAGRAPGPQVAKAPAAKTSGKKEPSPTRVEDAGKEASKASVTPTELQQGRHQEAEAKLREIIRLEPKNADAHNNLGVALNRQGSYQEAEAVLKQAIRLNPEDANAHSNLGIALWEQGHHQEAEAAFRHALKLNPQLEAASYNLQRVEKLQERVDAGQAPGPQVAKAPGRKKKPPTTPGEQLTSVIPHSFKATLSPDRVAKDEAGKGFDTAPEGFIHGLGGLRPDIGKRPDWLRSLPPEIQNDPQIMALKKERDKYIVTYQEKEKELTGLRQEMETAPPARKEELQSKIDEVTKERDEAKSHGEDKDSKMQERAKLLIDTRREESPGSKTKDQQ